jgi:hypothetical protein
MNKFFRIIVIGLCFFVALFDSVCAQNVPSRKMLLDIIIDEKNWDLLRYDHFQIKPSDALFQSVELLGALRDDNKSTCEVLIQKNDKPTYAVGGAPKGFRDNFVTASLVRIDSPALFYILDDVATNGRCKSAIEYLRTLMPQKSVEALLYDYAENFRLQNDTSKLYSSYNKIRLSDFFDMEFFGE